MDATVQHSRKEFHDYLLFFFLLFLENMSWKYRYVASEFGTSPDVVTPKTDFLIPKLAALHCTQAGT